VFAQRSAFVLAQWTGGRRRSLEVAHVPIGEPVSTTDQNPWQALAGMHARPTKMRIALLQGNWKTLTRLQ
jgi:hypothetical protein